MKPVIALVGRPNVGKSTLFNRLTRTRDALVADQAGFTRDRNYGLGKVGDRSCIVVDTGGLTDEKKDINQLIMAQALTAVQEANVILLLVDGRSGLTAGDESILAQLRPFGKPLILVINKCEGMEETLVSAEFQTLGLAHYVAISAAHGNGMPDLLAIIDGLLPLTSEGEDLEQEQGIRITFAGRPNVGKSTLVNRILGEQRVLTQDEPGTTRDSIYIPFEREGQVYTLIDTAGLRRRSKVADQLEKLSTIKTMQAIAEANVVILVVDARQGISDQDARVLGYILDSGKALVIAVNKWDKLDEDYKRRIKVELDRKFSFVDFASIHFISALHGTGITKLFRSVISAYRSATGQYATPQLTRLLESAVQQHSPPMVKGRQIKLRYAHQGGQNPPKIIIHGNQTESVPVTYRRYLENYFRKALKLEGTPVHIEFKHGKNPFAGKKNVLTKRQIDKRKRLKRFIKKNA